MDAMIVCGIITLAILINGYALVMFQFGRMFGRNDAIDRLDTRLGQSGVGNCVTLGFRKFQVQGTVRRNV